MKGEKWEKTADRVEHKYRHTQGLEGVWLEGENSN